MLKCGECTFFKEPEEGTRGQCGHPEKYTLIGDVMQRGICEYEDDCRYGYPDIWAARGAARLVRIQKAPASQINSSTTDLFSPTHPDKGVLLEKLKNDTITREEAAVLQQIMSEERQRAQEQNDILKAIVIIGILALIGYVLSRSE